MSFTVIKHIICELTGYRPGTVDVSQGDRGSRAVSCRLMENGASWIIPEGATARVAYTLPDGTEGLYDRRPDGSPMWEIAKNIVTVELADQLMAQVAPLTRGRKLKCLIPFSYKIPRLFLVESRGILSYNIVFPNSGPPRIGGSGLHHGRGHGITGDTGAVGAEDVGAGIFAAEDRPLGKQRQPAHCRRTAGPDHRIRQDLVVEGQIDGIVVPVEGHGIDIDGGINELCRTDLRCRGSVQHRLGFPGQVHPQILDAVLIPAGVGNFLGMDR